LKARYIVNVKAIKPIQETMVPKGNADSLNNGTFRIGEPATIRIRHEIRIIEER
jgi:hypothetical protein